MASMAMPALASAESIVGAGVDRVDLGACYELFAYDREARAWKSVGIIHDEFADLTPDHISAALSSAVHESGGPMRAYRVILRDGMGVVVAAMQPGNDAGSIVGDRAQSVGKPGDLRGQGSAGGVNSGKPTPKPVDATKSGFMRAIFGRPWRIVPT